MLNDALDNDDRDTAHTQHPMWETQVELERGMTREGAKRFQGATTKAAEKGRLTTLKPYQELLQAWIPKVADALRLWVKLNTTRKGGPVPIALEAITDINPYTAALIGLREILDQTSSRHMEVATVAIHIGIAIEHELQVCLWEKSLPKHFHDKRRELKQQKADHTHTERVNIHVFNKLLASGTFESGWERWGKPKHAYVGGVVLNAIIQATGWFETFRGAPEGTRKQEQFILQLKPGMETWITDRLNKLEECSPAFKPTVVPPKRWTGMRDGGYWTPYVCRPELIPLRAVHIQQREGARQEFDALEMPQVYAALHFLQETPWRVNKRIYDVMEESRRRNLAIGSIPEFRAKELPPKPIDIDTNEEAEKAWRREASRVRGDNAKMVSKQSLFSRTMLVACQFKEFERFYFPHSLDFRGRMYPIPTGLQPQGHDFARGLLEFAEGKPVTDEAPSSALWLAINLASAWGNDKISFDDRVKWVKANKAKWKRIAKDPLKTHAEWALGKSKGGADKPWQALAAILDWVGYLNAGPGYVSHATVPVDGTCNGLQHLSALGGDPIVGQMVNLVPGDKPNDVYQFVADALRDTLRRIAAAGGDQGDYARYWLSFGVGEDCKLPRKLVKRQVMTLAYSATRQAFFQHTKEWLDDNDQAPVDVDWSLRYKRIGFLVMHLWDAVSLAVPRALDIMKWLQECAACAAEGNQPIFWRTPDGFIVRHFYGKMRSFKVCVKLDNSRVELRLEEPTKDLDKIRQLRGIAPNYIHSLDATAARACINKAAEGGAITAFASVHDSFATHAADMWQLYHHLRRAFVELHEADVLTGYRNMCLRVMVDWRVSKGVDILDATAEAEEMLPEVPEVGDLDIRRVLESDYFFA